MFSHKMDWHGNCILCIVLPVFCILSFLYFVYCLTCILYIVFPVFCVLSYLYLCIVLPVFWVLSYLYFVYCLTCILCIVLAKNISLVWRYCHWTASIFILWIFIGSCLLGSSFCCLWWQAIGHKGPSVFFYKITSFQHCLSGPGFSKVG